MYFIYIYLYISVYIYIYIYLSIYLSIYLYIYIYISIYIYKYHVFSVWIFYNLSVLKKLWKTVSDLQIQYSGHQILKIYKNIKKYRWNYKLLTFELLLNGASSFTYFKQKIFNKATFPLFSAFGHEQPYFVPK